MEEKLTAQPAAEPVDSIDGYLVDLAQAYVFKLKEQLKPPSIGSAQ